jgi:hypothetical protein
LFDGVVGFIVGDGKLLDKYSAGAEEREISIPNAEIYGGRLSLLFPARNFEVGLAPQFGVGHWSARKYVLGVDGKSQFVDQTTDRPMYLLHGRASAAWRVPAGRVLFRPLGVVGGPVFLTGTDSASAARSVPARMLLGVTTGLDAALSCAIGVRLTGEAANMFGLAPMFTGALSFVVTPSSACSRYAAPDIRIRSSRER